VSVKTKSSRKAKVSIKVTRANGDVEHIGVVTGGTWPQRLAALVRLWVSNAKARKRWRLF